jgi:hypothetical protein
MGILSWIVFGLIAGIIAKLLMPGRDPGGCLRGRFPLQVRDRDRGVVLRVRFQKLRDSGSGSRGRPGRLSACPQGLSPKAERGKRPLARIVWPRTCGAR